MLLGHLTYLRSAASSTNLKQTINNASQVLKSFASSSISLSRSFTQSCAFSPTSSHVSLCFPIVRSLLIQEYDHQHRCDDRGQVILPEWVIDLLILNSVLASSSVELLSFFSTSTRFNSRSRRSSAVHSQNPSKVCSAIISRILSAVDPALSVGDFTFFAVDFGTAPFLFFALVRNLRIPLLGLGGPIAHSTQSTGVALIIGGT